MYTGFYRLLWVTRMKSEFLPKKFTKRRIATLKQLFALLVLGAGFVTFFWLDLNSFVSPQTLSENKELLSQWRDKYYILSVVFFVVVYGVLSAFSVPVGAWLTVTGGFIFGTFAGGFFSLLGATSGAMVIFFIARYSIGDVLRNKYGKSIKKMETGFMENQLSYMLVLRLVPLFPFWLVNLVPAFLEISTRSYLIGTLLGMTPGALVYASVGNGLSAIVESEIDPNMSIIYSPEILIPIIGLTILAFIPVLYKKLLK